MKRFEENILRIYSTSRLTNIIYTMFYGRRVPIFRSDPPTMMPHILASFHAQSRPSTPILRMKRTCSLAQKFECWAILSTQICDLSTIFQLIQYILLMIQKAQTTTWAPYLWAIYFRRILCNTNGLAKLFFGAENRGKWKIPDTWN